MKNRNISRSQKIDSLLWLIYVVFWLFLPKDLKQGNFPPVLYITPCVLYWFGVWIYGYETIKKIRKKYFFWVIIEELIAFKFCISHGEILPFLIFSIPCFIYWFCFWKFDSNSLKKIIYFKRNSINIKRNSIVKKVIRFGQLRYVICAYGTMMVGLILSKTIDFNEFSFVLFSTAIVYLMLNIIQRRCWDFNEAGYSYMIPYVIVNLLYTIFGKEGIWDQPNLSMIFLIFFVWNIVNSIGLIFRKSVDIPIKKISSPKFPIFVSIVYFIILMAVVLTI